MKTLWQRVKRFLQDESGPTALEYACMAALVIATCILAIALLGQETNALHTRNASQLTGS